MSGEAEDGAATTLFCLEIFVDTVDFTTGAEDAPRPEPFDLCFVFGSYPPLVVPAPDTVSHPHSASWITTRLGKKRLRATYQMGKSALFEADPVDWRPSCARPCRSSECRAATAS